MVWIPGIITYLAIFSWRKRNRYEFIAHQQIGAWNKKLKINKYYKYDILIRDSNLAKSKHINTQILELSLYISAKILNKLKFWF